MKLKLTLIALLIVAVSCSRPASNSQSYKLPSGKQIKVNGIQKMAFPNGESALIMNYETEIPIQNMADLRKEVDEIWLVFQKDVEKAGVKAGVIRATHYDGSGPMRSGNGYGFVYARGEDGQFHLVEDEKK